MLNLPFVVSVNVAVPASSPLLVFSGMTSPLSFLAAPLGTANATIAKPNVASRILNLL